MQVRSGVMRGIPEWDATSHRPRHEAFWARAAVDRPLVGIWLGGYFPLTILDTALREGSLEPNAIDVEHFADELETLMAENMLVGDDLPPATCAFWGIPWMEGIVGCPIRLAKDSCWAEAILQHPLELGEVRLDDSNLWLRALLAFTQRLVERSQGRYAIGLPVMRGPSDMAAALMGYQQMCLAMYDFPENMKDLFDRLAVIWVQVAKLLLDIIPVCEKGFVEGVRRLWAPRPFPTLQEDATIAFSPRLYRELLRDIDARIAASFDLVMMHLHSGSLHILDDVLSIEAIDAVEVSIDPQSSIDELIPLLARIKAQKSLAILGPLSQQEICQIRSNLSPEGLFILVVAEEHQEAKGVLAALTANAM